MTSVENVPITNGLSNGVSNGHCEQETTGINVFKEYMLKLLPYNPEWIRNAPASTLKNSIVNYNVTVSSQECGKSLSSEHAIDILQECIPSLSLEYKYGKPNSIGETACPLEIGVSDICGRYLQATRDIAPGEVLMVEPPLVLATRPKSPIHCSTCYKINCDFKCPNCGFFLCGPECLTEDHKIECQILRRLGFAELAEEAHEEEQLISERLSHMPPEKQAEAKMLLLRAKTSLSKQKHLEILQHYVVVATLRTLLAVQQNDFVKNLFLSMQANLDCDSPRFQMNQKLIVDVIVNRLEASTDTKLVHQICSIWDTNAFQVILPQNSRVQGLYPFAALINHNCRPNAQQWFTSKGEIVLRAVDHIDCGEMVTISYTDPQWCTVVRQSHLQKCKQFTCTCKRCNDATEMGTFIGSLACPSCGCPMVSSAPLHTTAPWVCTSADCSQTVEAQQVISVGTKLGALTQRLDPNGVKAAVSLAKALQKQVHPNHYSLLQLYTSIVNNVANKDLASLNDEKLSCLSGITSQVMKIVRMLQPPLARITATTSREDLRVQLEMLKRNKLSGENINKRLKALSTQVKECVQVLDWDSSMPSSSRLKQDYQDLVNTS